MRLVFDSSIKMRKLCVIIIICVMLVLIATDSSAYRTSYPMESEDICNPLGKTKTNKLPNSDDSAVIIKPDHMFDRWAEITFDKTCKFVFKTANRHIGLFAVVQEMSFRTNGTNPIDGTKNCIDYIQFEEAGGRSRKFCGTFNWRDRSSHKSGETPNSASLEKLEFKSPKGILETHIFVSKERLLPGEYLDISIAYTPYKECNKVNDPSKYPPNTNNTCIWGGYYCDGNKNCAFDNCLDEAGCETPAEGTSGAKVTMGAVGTIIFAFLLFLTCLWACRKNKKLCWSPDCAGPNIDRANSQPLDLRIQDVNSQSNVPSAPILHEPTTRPVQDKDLPPSYDSLFPDPTVAGTTT
ncbi:uncharacterized protein LOC124408042 [Diprion similis]|uniref:uncharacterized protein LOC124408042 n=1 Tax=Diprion similis TaxID=362088 RepID=UPI001EF86E70|nr:uncharacterized protein LOC124408042 [Diprion similis]